jgi:hypothetical protein
LSPLPKKGIFLSYPFPHAPCTNPFPHNSTIDITEEASSRPLRNFPEIGINYPRNSQFPREDFYNRLRSGTTEDSRNPINPNNPVNPTTHLNHPNDLNNLNRINQKNQID